MGMGPVLAAVVACRSCMQWIAEQCAGSGGLRLHMSMLGGQSL